MAESLYEVVTAAVRELSDTGFVSAERLAYWQARIKEAAERSMTSQADMERMLHEALAQVYRRMVEKGGAAKYHGGVDKFTIDKLSPRLRTELQRRILAAADLIKLNREEAIQKTLRRFSGWATSIPAGGSETVERTEEKQHIRKALSSLPFAERRVIIDQGHKLAASINDVIAKDGGAIAVVWNSRWRQPGYNYREDHKERDRNIYLLRDSWARTAGLVKPGEAGCYEDITAFAEEPFCRCFGTWLYHLRQLPDEMLTAKGRAELERAKKAISA